jgi:excisionase family DNA binding protein
MNPSESSVGPTSVPRLAVGRREAASMLSISERLLWTWTNAGIIPHVRLGTRVLYPVDRLREWLAQQATAGASSRAPASSRR